MKFTKRAQSIYGIFLETIFHIKYFGCCSEFISIVGILLVIKCIPFIDTDMANSFEKFSHDVVVYAAHDDFWSGAVRTNRRLMASLASFAWKIINFHTISPSLTRYLSHLSLFRFHRKLITFYLLWSHIGCNSEFDIFQSMRVPIFTFYIVRFAIVSLLFSLFCPSGFPSALFNRHFS